MDQGYVKLWRKSVDSGIMQNPNLWTFWSWCLMKASHKKRKQVVGMQMVDLNPGDFIFGRKAASEALGISERTIRTCSKKLKKFGNVTIKATNKFSVISIVNWDTYQCDALSSDQQSDQQVTSKRPASDHRQECKKESIKEVKTPLPPQGEKPDSKDNSLKNYLSQKIESGGFQEIKDQINTFFEYRQAKPKAKKYQTEKGVNGLFRNLAGCRDAGLNLFDCLEIAMENNWQTPDVKYYKGSNENNTGGRFPNGTIMGSKRMDGNLMACQQFIEDD